MNGTQSLECRTLSHAAWLSNIYRAAAAAGLGLFVAAALAVFWRQAAGALRHPLHPLALLVAATTVTAAAIALRASLGGASRTLSSRLDRAITLVISLALIELTVGLCLPKTPAACVVAVGLLVATEETWAWRRCLRRAASCCHLPCVAGPGPAAAPAEDCQLVVERGADCQPATETGQVNNLPHNSTCDVPSDDIVQQLTRTRADTGAEEIAGWLRTSFAAHQRTASVHVAFCPPLNVAPEVAVEQVDGPDARIKVAQVLAYGVRLDLKLATAMDEPASVLLQFSAHT
ncbi:MAG: hypothetical protein LLG00_04895 [Planctomycetaceae bacterium]|nr:hypothetical protein [Planctomycetaceae bacterium]